MENKSEKQEQKERVSIFIDGSNFYHGLKRMGVKNFPLQDFISVITGERELVKIHYYKPQLDPRSTKEKYHKDKKFLTYIKMIPKMHVVICALKRIKENELERYEIKGDDIHLANDLVVGAYEDIYDIAVLVSGDEDFIPVVKTVQRLHKRVENVYFRKSSSHHMRKLCNTSTNIKLLIQRIEKLR